MNPNAEPAEPPADRPITASEPVSGEIASILRDMSAILGRTPEELAIDYAAGVLKIPTEPYTGEWGFFDGPPDLASNTEQYLREWCDR
jgi:hypothetical protein